MVSYFRFVLRHRLAITIACGLVTLLVMGLLSRATVGSSLAELVLGDHPAYQRYVELVGRFGSDEQLIVAWKTDLGDPAEVARLERIVERVAAHFDVARVASPLDMAERTEEGGLDALSLVEHPLAGGLLVSHDGRAITLVAGLAQDRSRALERTPVIGSERGRAGPS